MNALKRLHGVQEVDVNLQRGWVKIVPRGDEELALERIPEVIRAAGFRVGELQVAGRASLEPEGAQAWLRWEGWSSRMLLCSPGPGGGQGSRKVRGTLDSGARTACIRLEPAR